MLRNVFIVILLAAGALLAQQNKKPLGKQQQLQAQLLIERGGRIAADEKRLAMERNENQREAMDFKNEQCKAAGFAECTIDTSAADPAQWTVIEVKVEPAKPPAK